MRHQESSQNLQRWKACSDELPCQDRKSGGVLQGLKREILSIDDYEEQKERASWIEQSLFEATVTISCLKEEEKKVPTGDSVGIPMMDRVNLPRIEILRNDGNILNW